MKIVFSVRCKPEPQPRQRHRIFKTRGGKLAVQSYTPADSPVTTFKDRIRFESRRVHRGEPLTGPLAVEMVLVLERPQYLGKGGRKWHETRGDVDNYAKSILDALLKVAFVDDGQVAELSVRKQIAAAGEEPSVSVSIEQLEPVGGRVAVQKVMF